jgi:hypothetical protein
MRQRSIIQVIPSVLRCLWLLLLALAACQGSRQGRTLEANTPPAAYLPPTVASPAIAQASPTFASVDERLVTPTPSCANDLTYLSDLTIPDGTVVDSGQALDKRWQVQNTGSCNWDERYRLKLVAGPDLGGRAEQALYPARSGALAVIRIQFAAPAEAGNYRSAWQAFTPQGEPFGDPVYVEIVVQAPAP